MPDLVDVLNVVGHKVRKAARTESIAAQAPNSAPTRTTKFPRVITLGILSLILQNPIACLADQYTALPDLIDRIKPSVVGVGTHDPLRRPPSKLMGTGFAVADGSLVVTNSHVVPKALDLADNENLVVFVGAGRNPEIRKASRAADDPAHDVTLLRVGGKRLPALNLGNTALVREGMSIAFSGFPIGAILGLYPVTHTGTISAITPIAIPARRGSELTSQQVLTLRDPYDVFQLDATAYPGNSGSPLFRLDTGDVIGIVNRVFVKDRKEKVLSDPSAITYAIPGNYIKVLLGKKASRPGE